ncbi:DUF4377 domain-containing protein [Christiangramia sabulilitoris]|uniref:DUF4377 domain-containing protein n=1 Tax=Christiangramia sabulilitoris TaxID=2583991 RepID=A0A550I6T0_9FLAO|nr:DUF4377 domain-containing protein [Christiangramia sabulilitoris]TRO66684.1 DUF4377 domain-containing protein [Christiangramia sabulilitoris]
MHFKFIHLFVLVIVLFAGANSCSLVGENEQDRVLIEMRINHFQQTAFGSYPLLVLLAQENESIGGADWKYFYDEIEGFNYKPGYIYDLKVIKKSVQDPPQDASAFKYILHSVVAKNPVSSNEIFEIRLKWNGENFVHTTEGSAPSLIQEYEINCDTLCDELTSRLETEEEVSGIFQHEGDRKIKLIELK